MAQLAHFYRDRGSPVEYVVIVDTHEDMTEAEIIEEYGDPSYKLGDVVDIDGDVTSFPTDRELTP